MIGARSRLTIMRNGSGRTHTMRGGTECLDTRMAREGLAGFVTGVLSVLPVFLLRWRHATIRSMTRNPVHLQNMGDGINRGWASAVTIQTPYAARVITTIRTDSCNQIS